MRFRNLAITLTLGALSLTACGNDSDEATSSDTTLAASSASADSATPTPVDASFNQADVEFAQGMIPHHEQAIEMAEIALDPSVSAGKEVRSLATRIQGAQDGEIELMKGWLSGWNQPLQMDTSGGHDMSTMDGMMSADEMNALELKKGAEFDVTWMEMMIRHHEGAIEMATTVKSAGSDPDVAVLADQIIAAQQGEITEMKELLG